MNQDRGWGLNVGGQEEKAWSFRGSCQLHARGWLGPAGAQVTRGLLFQKGGWLLVKDDLQLLPWRS